MRTGPVERCPNILSDSLSPRPIFLSSSVKAEEIAASMKQLKISCWNLLESFALDACAPPQLTLTVVVVRVDQTRINRHAKIVRTCWCHRRSLVASYSIVIEHYFGMGQSYVLLSCASFSNSCQKKHFAVRALSTANACTVSWNRMVKTHFVFTTEISASHHVRST